MTDIDTRSLVHIALFAALTAALALFPPVTLPAIAVPITAQSLGVMLAGSVAGPKRGGLALLLFVALVAVGLPLLAGGRGGLGVLAGPSGGFILSWPICAFVIGWLVSRFAGQNGVAIAICISFGGIVVMYAIGVPWMALMLEMPLSKAIYIMLAYVPGDLIKVAIATVITMGLRRALPNL